MSSVKADASALCAVYDVPAPKWPESVNFGTTTSRVFIQAYKYQISSTI